MSDVSLPVLCACSEIGCVIHIHKRVCVYVCVLLTGVVDTVTLFPCACLYKVACCVVIMLLLLYSCYLARRD